jgi:hypothetical protein
MIERTQCPAVPVQNRFNALPKVKKLAEGREWTYFVRADCPQRFVKIGHSVNLKWRLAGLQTQCPVQLSLVGLVDAPAGTELLFHEALAKSRSHGEWFFPTPELERIRTSLPKAGSIEGPAIVELLAPFGVTQQRVHQVFVWALSTIKHTDSGAKTLHGRRRELQYATGTRFG